jgi:hypothetical protein
MKIQKFVCALFSLAFLFSCSNEGSNETTGFNPVVDHAWVIDGMASVYVPIPPNYYPNYYVHNNWGWNGKEDGYYLEGVYDPEAYSDVYYNFKNIKVGLVYR